LPAIGRIDDNVVQDARWSAQRHVVVPLDSRVGVSNHGTVALGGKDDDVRLIELRPEKPAVSLGGLRRWRQEALRVEVVVLTDQKCAELAEGGDVCRRCRADVNGRAQRSTIDICFSL
jgi:hypothetical protein